jgi:hypothetical protein
MDRIVLNTHRRSGCTLIILQSAPSFYCSHWTYTRATYFSDSRLPKVPQLIHDQWPLYPLCLRVAAIASAEGKGVVKLGPKAANHTLTIA